MLNEMDVSLEEDKCGRKWKLSDIQFNGLATGQWHAVKSRYGLFTVRASRAWKLIFESKYL